MKGKELSRKTQPQCCHPKRPQAGKLGAKNNPTERRVKNSSAYSLIVICLSMQK